MMPASKLLGNAIALALTAASTGTASAGQLDYTLYSGLMHSDNVSLSDTNPVSQNVLIPGVNFAYTQTGSSVQANAAGTLEYRDYLGNAFSNQTLAQLSSQVNWTVMPKRLDFTVQDFAGVQPLSTFASNAPNNQQQTNVLTLGPTLHFRLGDTMQGQAELRYINSDASKNKEFNSSRGEAALRVFKDLSNNSQLSANFETQSVDFQQSSGPAFDLPGTTIVNPNYTRNELFAHYVGTFTHFDLNSALGWSQIDFRGAPNVSSPLIRVAVNWLATPSNHFGITAVRQYSDAAEDMILQQGGQTMFGTDAMQTSALIAPLGINTGNSVVDAELYLDRHLEATYAFNSERVSFSISPRYGHSDFLNNPVFNQSDRGGSGVFNFKLTPLTTIFAFGASDSITYRSIARRDKTSDYGIGLAQQRTPHWGWRVSLTHQLRTSTVPNNQYSENELYVGIVYKR